MLLGHDKYDLFMSLGHLLRQNLIIITGRTYVARLGLHEWLVGFSEVCKER